MCPPFPTIHNPILDLCLVDICNKLQWYFAFRADYQSYLIKKYE
jgi:hypothetical protein